MSASVGPWDVLHGLGRVVHLTYLKFTLVPVQQILDPAGWHWNLLRSNCQFSGDLVYMWECLEFDTCWISCYMHLLYCKRLVRFARRWACGLQKSEQHLSALCHVKLMEILPIQATGGGHESVIRAHFPFPSWPAYRPFQQFVNRVPVLRVCRCTFALLWLYISISCSIVVPVDFILWWGWRKLVLMCWEGTTTSFCCCSVGRILHCCGFHRLSRVPVTQTGLLLEGSWVVLEGKLVSHQEKWVLSI